MNDRSELIFETLVAKYPDEPLFHYDRGLALIEGGQKARAKQELGAAILQSPSADLRMSIYTALKGIN
jgi:predicted Zn-dependent protease